MEQGCWQVLIQRGVEKYRTPFYLFSSQPILEQLRKLHACGAVPIENWLSIKTLPVRNLLTWWHSTGFGVEATSEYELLAAQEAGYSGKNIIVNGVGKHCWSRACWSHGLRVNFDSLEEIRRLGSIARELQWSVGMRFHASLQQNPDHPGEPDQFGIPADSFRIALDLLNRLDLQLDMVHVHLRSNIPNADIAIRTLDELEQLLRSLDIGIPFLDLGGGIPAEMVVQTDEHWESAYSVDGLNNLIDRAVARIPGLQHIIAENGRFMLAGCGVLVLSVNDVKEIGGVRFLICDGGRTNHALPSDWEEHRIGIMPSRSEKLVETSVCGPTCMAYDCLAKVKLSDNIVIGDKVVWYDAGAYHLPWETRFSGPIASVIWHDGGEDLVEARARERFEEWWGRWQ